MRHYAADEVQAAHEHDHVQVSLVLRGGVSETVGQAEQVGTALSVVVKGAGLAHANSFGPTGATILQLAIPLDTIAPLLDSPARGEPWRWLHDPAAAQPLVGLLRSMQTPTESVALGDPALTDVLAAITARPVPTRGSAPAWLLHVRARLEEEWDPHVTVASVAAQAGVHPVYLARSMRRWFRIGVAEELRRARVRAAAKRVATGEATLSRVAHATGYADEPHLCRDFGRAVGLSPGRYRQLLSRFAS